MTPQSFDYCPMPGHGAIIWGYETPVKSRACGSEPFASPKWTQDTTQIRVAGRNAPSLGL